MPPPVSRRAFLRLTGGLALLTAFEGGPAVAATGSEYFAAAYQSAEGGYGVAVFTADGQLIHDIGLPGRGHDVTLSPRSGHYVAFARRPGTFAVVFDIHSKHPSLTLTSAPGRHFYGHGVFSPDGRLLYTTENDYDAGDGIIGVYNTADDFRRIGEFPSHGVGPHQLALMADGTTLVIANGGIETHPDFGRRKLNLATMQPNIAFMNRDSGDLLDRQSLPADLHQLSLRHLAVAADQTVWIGGQYEGPVTDQPPLIASLRRDGQIDMINQPDVTAGLKNYIGSVAVSRDGARVATSAPRGDRVLIWSARDRRLIREIPVAAGCGAAPATTGFLLSGPTGEILSTDTGAGQQVSGHRWDNHISRLQA